MDALRWKRWWREEEEERARERERERERDPTPVPASERQEKGTIRQAQVDTTFHFPPPVRTKGRRNHTWRIKVREKRILFSLPPSFPSSLAEMPKGNGGEGEKGGLERVFPSSCLTGNGASKRRRLILVCVAEEFFLFSPPPIVFPLRPDEKRREEEGRKKTPFSSFSHPPPCRAFFAKRGRKNNSRRREGGEDKGKRMKKDISS